MTTPNTDLHEQIDKAFDLLHHVDGGLDDATAELLRIVKAAQADAWDEGCRSGAFLGIVNANPYREETP